jgi:hypothetical protein
MDNIYIKIDNFFYKEKPIFYKKQIENGIHKATEFNDKYNYYYDWKQNGEMFFLGKFITKSKQFSSSIYNDYDYDVYEFEKDTIYCDKAEFIFCCAIPESNESMVLVPDLNYFDFPIYYKKK